MSRLATIAKWNNGHLFSNNDNVDRNICNFTSIGAPKLKDRPIVFLAFNNSGEIRDDQMNNISVLKCCSLFLLRSLRFPIQSMIKVTKDAILLEHFIAHRACKSVVVFFCYPCIHRRICSPLYEFGYQSSYANEH